MANFLLQDVFGTYLNMYTRGGLREDERALINGVKEGEYTLLWIIPKAGIRKANEKALIAGAYADRYEKQLMIQETEVAFLIFSKKKYTGRDVRRFKQFVTRRLNV